MMKSSLLVITVLVPLCFFTYGYAATGNLELSEAQRMSPPYLMAHYMPWFLTPEVRGEGQEHWGPWTMENCNPDSILPNGQRQIAAHFYPLTGPYDSSDPHILEYQTLLMTLSGIDGVIVDWPGNQEHSDSHLLNENTVKLFSYIKKTQLKFALCYEDAIIKFMVEGGDLSETEAINFGQGILMYAQDNWLRDDSYLKINDRPVLLNWGPNYYSSSADWDSLFSVLDTEPVFITLHDNEPIASGKFAWPPMWASVDDILSEEAMNDYLTEFYSASQSWDHLVAGAWPGFHDYYMEGGQGATLGYLDPQDGLTFESTLQSAMEANPDVIQIVTWNAWDEGTIIEPSVEFEYKYLEMIQDFRRENIDPSFPYQPEDLELPLRIFNLRKIHKDSDEYNVQLDQAFDHIIAGDLNTAVSIVNSIPESRRVSPPYLMVHYMPWFVTAEKSGNGTWDGHWTMGNRDPSTILPNGQRDIAAHYYPLTGPYDSKDPHILEYHTLLMILSGVDGVIVDWYGNEDYNDYGFINESTNELFTYIKNAQLKFSICYEDATVNNMVNDGHVSETEAHSYGQEVMQYMQDNWFEDETYLKINGSPVLLNFGPQYYNESSDWDTLFTVLDSTPLFFPLNESLAPSMAGSFPWPPMSSSVDGVLSEESLNSYLTGFYDQSATWDHLVAGAWPGFHDFYMEGGYGFTYGYLDSQDGLTFESTLESAINADPDIIQIVTWNDWGEGTIIEPSVEFEYQYLEMLQEFRRENIDPSFPYQSEDLELPLHIYNLRKRYDNSSVYYNEIHSQLDQAFGYIVSGDLASAESIVNSIPDSIQRVSPPHIMVHYMTFFQTPEVHGYWGWNWTHYTCNPDSILPNGQRQIASHFYPLTGPYDTRDPHLLEYQTLLMKLSGIDGVIVDWGLLKEDPAKELEPHESTVDVFNYIKKAQLKFALCWEDITVKEMIEMNYMSESEKYSFGQEVMLYMQDNYFKDDVYLKINNRPVLLNFGPMYFFESADWDTLFTILDTMPMFFPIDHEFPGVSAGSTPWVPMQAQVDGVVTEEAMNNWLTDFYDRSLSWDHLIAGAWPGDHDYYMEGGSGFTFGYLDSQDGWIFESTLKSAIEANPDAIQIVTWNAWDEGTNIEPSVEYGYQYLEMLQEFRREHIDPSFPHQPEDLLLPLQIFNLRKTYKDSTRVNTLLDKAFDHIIAGNPASAADIIQYVQDPSSALKGDVDGDEKINIFDLLTLLQVLAGIETNQDVISRSDVDSSGSTNIFDLLELLTVLSRSLVG
jgi:glycosyl hydrolase family 99/dockerin type I repeat protein/glycosyl transferase family WbsX